MRAEPLADTLQKGARGALQGGDVQHRVDGDH